MDACRTKRYFGNRRIKTLTPLRPAKRDYAGQGKEKSVWQNN